MPSVTAAATAAQPPSEQGIAGGILTVLRAPLCQHLLALSIMLCAPGR